MYSNYP